MKRLNLFHGMLLTLLVSLLPFGKAAAQEAYAHYDNNGTFTFYYDNNRSSRSGVTFDLNEDYEPPLWRQVGYDDVYQGVTHVVFDASFADARPTTTYSWFDTMINLTSITGMAEYLNTSEVTSMQSMFALCDKLTTIDVSNFDTSKVTDMVRMFFLCKGVTDLDLSNFDTRNVTTMGEMFSECQSLTSLDLSSFNTESVMDMNSMFESCLSLKTIIVGDGWSTYNVTESERMFIWCFSLVGGRGTVYDENHIDSSYAHIDGGPSDPGYLTLVPSDGPYAVYADGTLTFYYDKARLSHSGYSFDLNENGSDPAWLSFADAVTTVVFDSTFVDYYPSTTQGWFKGMKNLTTIEGMYDYLVTYEVSDMSGMFYECESLTELDLTNFQTLNVSNMSEMFRYCERLKTIFVSGWWNTDWVRESRNMFDGCYSIVGNMGTTYDDLHLDVTYARIDEPPYKPGYLTRFPEPYAIFKDGTLTIYYDGKGEQRDGKYFYIHDGQYDQRWYSDNTYQSVTSVVIDESVKSYRPKSLYAWFNGMDRLTSITGLEYLNTSRVTNMSLLFAYCKRLKSLDLSSFDTHNVGNMQGMFMQCESLQSLDLSTFDTSEVIFMNGMFDHCTSLQSLDLTSFNTEMVTDMTDMFYYCSSLKTLNLRRFRVMSVTSMFQMFAYCKSLETLDLSNFQYMKINSTASMFEGCTALKSIDLSNFFTDDVTSMTNMFYGCSSLTTLDLGSFNTEKVFDMRYMFAGCQQLRTIYVSHVWTTQNVTRSNNMFAECYNIVSGLGTRYDSNYIDATYAVIDGRYDTPGYLTDLEFYAVYDNEGTLYFHYDNERSTFTTPTYSYTGFEWADPEWILDGTNEKIQNVVFDSSVRNARLRLVNRMFDGLINLQEIVDFHNLNTSEATGMYAMFRDCRSLVSLNLYGFNTSNVTTMGSMFECCTQLESINFGDSFDTGNVVYMDFMFEQCRNLVDVDLSGFNTSNVTSMMHMLSQFATEVPVIDLSSFDTRKVENMVGMFRDNWALERIYVGDNWSTDAVVDDRLMFANCSSLVGMEGTAYTSAHEGRDYAHIDGGTANPGYLSTKPYAVYDGDGTLTFYFDTRRKLRQGTVYDVPDYGQWPGWQSDETAGEINTVVFTPSFKNARPTATFGWFHEMPLLTNIRGMAENLNTSCVLSMEAMFYNCQSLKSIDFSAFDTRRVRYMDYMFYNCISLTDLDLSTFDTYWVKNMAYMFRGCENLSTLNLSSFYTLNVTNMKAMFRGCRNLRTLNLSSFYTPNVMSMEGMFWCCSNLENLYINNFDTHNVLSMLDMFYYCHSLSYLNLTSFDTRNTKLFGFMFEQCENLRTIEVGSGWKVAPDAKTPGMFLKCYNLVGGKGTVYDDNHLDGSYAHVDGGPSNPGYFTGSFLPGDVNNDGQVGIGDIVAITNVMAGIETDTGTVSRADVNGDNQVGIGDIVAITNIMAGVQ